MNMRVGSSEIALTPADLDAQKRQAALDRYQTLLLSMFRGTSGTGENAKSSVPSLAAAHGDPSAVAVVLAYLGGIQAKSDLQAGITAADQEKDQKKFNQEEMIKQLEEQQKKAEEAAKLVSQQKVGSWLSAIFSVLGAALTCVSIAFSGGATAPLVAAAVIQSITAIQNVINIGLKEGGVKTDDGNGGQKQVDISFAGIADAIVTSQLKDGSIALVERDSSGKIISDSRDKAKANFGDGCIVMDKNQLEQWKMGWSITSEILVAATSIACGAGAYVIAKAASKAGDAVKVLSKLSQQLERIGNIGELSAQAAEGTTSIITGGLAIKAGEIDADSDRARARKELNEKLAKFVLDLINRQTESLKRSVENNNELCEMVTQIIAETVALNREISRNAVSANG
jgi:phage baseplate assembly protein gpV